MGYYNLLKTFLERAMAVMVIALLYNYLFMIANLCKLIYNIFTQTSYHYNNEMR
mgnify:CR=1 FL=1